MYTLLSYRCGAAVSSRRTSAICDLWALQYLSDILALIFSFRDGCIFPPRTAKKGIKGMRAVTFIVRSGRQNLLAFPARAPREKTGCSNPNGKYLGYILYAFIENVRIFDVFLGGIFRSAAAAFEDGDAPAPLNAPDPARIVVRRGECTAFPGAAAPHHKLLIRSLLDPGLPTR